jgi:RHS repeat-associated protein
LNYSYGFQGQEKDDEVKGEGNSLNFEFRMYDPRIGRFFAVDPLAAKYPIYTPYSFSGNHVINAVELEGLEEEYKYNVYSAMEEASKPSVKKEDVNSVYNQALENQKILGAASPESILLGVVLGIDAGLGGWGMRLLGLSALGENMNQTDSYHEANSKGDKQKAARHKEEMKAPGAVLTGAIVGEALQFTIVRGMSALRKVGIRKDLASAFLTKNGYTGERASSHMSAINFNKVVKTTTLKKGTVVEQWVGENGVGNYFTYLGKGEAKNLGISYEGRKLTKFVLTEDVKVLESTAADFGGNSGGGTQLFSTKLKAKAVKLEE